MAFIKDELFEADKGVALTGGTSGIIKSGKGATFFSEEHSQKITYTGSDVDYVEFFSGATQITANRMLKITVNYSGGEPSGETWEFFDSDGTTVLETRAYTYTVVSGSIQSVTELIT